MVLEKRHLWIAAFVAVLAIAYFAQRTENLNRDRASRHAQVVSCERASGRTAIIAAWAMDASRTRASSGDKTAALRYEGYANSIIGTIPAMPADNGSLRLADVEEIKNPRTGKLSYRLTEDAKRLQVAGCEAAYPAP